MLHGTLAVDSLDPCGVYFGTTGGQVYTSADSGEFVDCDLQAAVVEVQTL